MVQLGRSASLAVVLLLLLVSVGAASAECAWVLWYHERVVGRPRIQRGPTLMRSQKRLSCVSRLEELEKKMNKQVGYTITRLSDTHVVRFKLPVDDGFQSLPDTVDPRGPKGR